MRAASPIIGAAATEPGVHADAVFVGDVSDTRIAEYPMMASMQLLSSRRPGRAGPTRLARRIAASMLRNRHALARRLWEGLAGWRKYDRWSGSNAEELDAKLKLEFHVFIDYLASYFASGDDVYKHLYIGEKLKQLQDRSLDPEREYANRRRVTDADLEVLCGATRAELGAPAAELLESLLRDVQRVVLARPQASGSPMGRRLPLPRCARIPRGEGAEEGITFEPTVVTSKNPVEQREQLRALAERRFDAIFYSPVTYEFSWDLNAYLKVGQWMTSRHRVGQTVSTAMDEVEKTLEVLATRFDSPTYVHNTAHVRRHDSTPAELVKVWLTRRVRRLVREGVGARLAERVAACRADDANLIVFDETALLARYGDFSLGRYVYPTKVQHPAEMGRRVADGYRDILATIADLAGKKVVVCDLDNTLWKGEIGEGAVEHFAGYRGALKALRHKGVLLAVNSKNDPRNVRWDGALLTEGDFVNMQINWDSKVANMRRIQQALNVKLKDFVFIDDRADQRELIHEALPEVCVLDANSPRLAARLAHWAAALPDNPETDRTRLYRERAPAGKLLVRIGRTGRGPSIGVRPARNPGRDPRCEAGGAEARGRVDQSHQSVQPGRQSDQLDRVAEVVRRAGRRIVVADARDKFGPMGLVGAVARPRWPGNPDTGLRPQLPRLRLRHRGRRAGRGQAASVDATRASVVPDPGRLRRDAEQRAVPGHVPAERIHPRRRILGPRARRCPQRPELAHGPRRVMRPSGNIQQPQRRRPFGDLLGVHDGLGLELDVDRAAAGQVGGGDEEAAVAVDGELDADRAPGRQARRGGSGWRCRRPCSRAGRGCRARRP